MSQVILPCFLILLGHAILAHNHAGHDSTSNDLSLTKILKDSGAGNNCDIIMLPQDQEECVTESRASEQDNHCYLEFGNEFLGNVEVSPRSRFQVM